MNPSCVGVVALSSLLAACSASGSSPSLVVGSDGTGGAGGGLPGSGGAFVVGVGDAGISKTLTAHIESPPGVTVTFVTVTCTSQCADVIAVATGGFEPYAFTWEDGSTNPARHVCPTSTTSYQVSVTDSGSTSVEFKRDPQTVTALLTANVIQCPDGGTIVPVNDGGGTAPGGPCIVNPSFEGTAAGTAGAGSPFAAAPWVDCILSGADVVNGTTLPPSGSSGSFPSAADGSTYIGMTVQPLFGGDVSEPLCATMRAGTTYGLGLSLASAIPTSSPAASLEIWGATASCGAGQLLWSSPPGEPSWKTYCATLTPTVDTTFLTLRYRAGSGYLLVDHLVPVDRCP